MPEDPKPRSTDERDFDIVDEASADSFPASDPPGWATGQLAEDEDNRDTANESASARRARGTEKRKQNPESARGSDTVRKKSA